MGTSPTLDVSDPLLTDEALQTMIEGRVLTSVNLSGCRGLTDEGIKTIATSSLVDLSVAMCGLRLTDESVLAVAANCPSLKRLVIADCKFITDRGLTAIAAGCGSLTELDCSRCPKLTDASVKAVVAGCPSLTKLNLRNCKLLSDEAVTAVASLTELHTLRIFGCRKLTNASIEALADCATLTTLDTTNTFRQTFKASRSDA